MPSKSTPNTGGRQGQGPPDGQRSQWTPMDVSKSHRDRHVLPTPASVKKNTEKCLKLHREIAIGLIEVKEKCMNLNRRVRHAAKLVQSPAFIETLHNLTKPAVTSKPSTEPRDDKLPTPPVKGPERRRPRLLASDVKQEPIDNFFCNARGNAIRSSSPNCVQFSAAFKTLMTNNFADPAPQFE